MQDWQKFKTFKQRGEWVELQFMAAAASHGYRILKPWGDNLEYDSAIEHRGDLLRVQVKASSARHGTGYVCQLKHGGHGRQMYRVDDLDIFALYVVPEALWYVIPAVVVLTPKRRSSVILCPVMRPQYDRYKFEQYREAWGLLSKTRRDLTRLGKRR